MSKVKKSTPSIVRRLINPITQTFLFFKSGALFISHYRKHFAVFSLAVALVGGIIGVRANFDDLSAAMVGFGFGVKDVTLIGRHRSQKDEILAVLDVEVGTPILSINLAQKQAEIEVLPWVKSARIVRRLPNLLHIELEEYEPFARLERDKVLTLVDRTGARITNSYLEGFNYLPIISGDGVEMRAAHLMDTLKGYPVIRNRLVSAVWVKGRRWTLHLDHGGSLLLPEEGFEQALKRLMAFEATQRVLAVGNQTIDLRIDERVLLRPNRSTQNKSASDEARS